MYLPMCETKKQAYEDGSKKHFSAKERYDKMKMEKDIAKLVKEAPYKQYESVNACVKSLQPLSGKILRFLYHTSLDRQECVEGAGPTSLKKIQEELNIIEQNLVEVLMEDLINKKLVQANRALPDFIDYGITEKGKKVAESAGLVMSAEDVK